jgi:sugar lactone lactonase YvrE
VVAVAALALGMMACGDSGDGSSGDLPTSAPGRLTKIADTGFASPGDAVSSPDGATFYFTAYTEGSPAQPAVFRVPSAGGTVEALHAGTPLGYPTGLVMSCDGSTLFVADMGITQAAEGAETPAEDEEMELVDGSSGGLFTLATAGGAIARLEAEGISVPTGLALGVDCRTLYVTGWDEEARPALFTLPVTGGSATVVHAGEPLSSPTGLHVDADGVAWVMDHLASTDDGEGVLFAITGDGDVTPVIGGLRMGTPGGVSLVSGGGRAVIPSLDDEGNGQLITVEIATGEVTVVPAPDIQDPAGLRTARQAGVFAVVDSEGSAIWRAEH